MAASESAMTQVYGWVTVGYISLSISACAPRFLWTVSMVASGRTILRGGGAG